MPRSSNTTSVKVDKYNQNQAKVSPLTWVAIAGFFVSIILILVLLTPNNQEKILEAYEAYGVTTMPVMLHALHVKHTLQQYQHTSHQQV